MLQNPIGQNKINEKLVMPDCEFTLKYQRSFNHHQMGYIKNIGDLIEHYHDLYAFWTREVARLIFFNYLDYSNAQLTEKEKYIINGLEQYGFEVLRRSIRIFAL